MIRKLYKRFNIISMSLVSVVLIITFSVLIISSANRMEKESFRNLEDDYTRLYTPDKPDGFSDKPDEIVDVQLSQPFDGHSSFSTFFVTLDESGAVTQINDLSRNLTDETIENAVSAVLAQSKTDGVINSLSLRYMVFNDSSGQRILGFIDMSYEKSFLQQQVLSYSFIGLGSLGAFLIISLILSNLALRPIKKAWEQQRQFVADASHELKTPITVMLANTSILLSDNKSGGNNDRKWITNIDLEAKHMKKLVEDLLFLARMDATEKDDRQTRLDLSDVIYQSVLPFEAVMFESGKSLDTDISPNIHIKGNPAQIKQLVSIFLDNAQKYAHENSKVTIRLSKENNKAVLSVHNLSDPIAEEDLSHIFDRFIRADKARSRDRSSYGLGLAIAKEITAAHKGRISVNSNQKTGTTFTVSLPLA